MKRNIARIAAGMNGILAAAEAAAAQTLARAAERAAEDARSLAPVDTGELRGSISVVAHSPLEVSVVASAPHAAMVEFGTTQMAAQPFMTPAAQMQRASLLHNAREAFARRKGGKA